MQIRIRLWRWVPEEQATFCVWLSFVEKEEIPAILANNRKNIELYRGERLQYQWNPKIDDVERT